MEKLILLWPKRPRVIQRGGSVHREWRTKCGRYCVSRHYCELASLPTRYMPMMRTVHGLVPLRRNKSPRAIIRRRTWRLAMLDCVRHVRKQARSERAEARMRKDGAARGRRVCFSTSRVRRSGLTGRAGRTTQETG